MTAPGCPRCGDQTLWSIGRRFDTGNLYGYCRLCKHEWHIPEQNVYRTETERGVGATSDDGEAASGVPPRSVFACDDPEGDWIKDQQEATRD